MSGLVSDPAGCLTSGSYPAGKVGYSQLKGDYILDNRLDENPKQVGISGVESAKGHRLAKSLKSGRIGAWYYGLLLSVSLLWGWL